MSSNPSQHSSLWNKLHKLGLITVGLGEVLRSAPITGSSKFQKIPAYLIFSGSLISTVTKIIEDDVTME